jgi:hypothetical protein
MTFPGNAADACCTASFHAAGPTVVGLPWSDADADEGTLETGPNAGICKKTTPKTPSPGARSASMAAFNVDR